jgi:hypothetical protein
MDLGSRTQGAPLLHRRNNNVMPGFAPGTDATSIKRSARIRQAPPARHIVTGAAAVKRGRGACGGIRGCSFARVARVLDGLEEQVPGALPEAIAIEGVEATTSCSISAMAASDANHLPLDQSIIRFPGG